VRRVTALALGGLGLLAVAVCALPRLAARGMLQPYRRDDADRASPESWARLREADIDAVPLEFEGDGGVLLRGWRFVPPGGADRVVVYVHGITDCGTSGIGLAQPLARRGIELVVFDQRAHGRSGGTACTYGVVEKRDVSRLIDVVASSGWTEPARPVGLYGASLGAAVAIQAAAFDPRVAALVAQSSFCDLRSVAHDYARRFTGLDWPWLADAVLKRVESLGGFRVDDASPIRVVGDVRCPILFVTGDCDAKISCAYTERLFEAATAAKRLLVIPKAGHDDVLAVGGDVYMETLASFFDASLR
jgi:uncharacterized protein